MRFVSMGMKKRVLVFFDEGEEAPQFLTYRKSTFRQMVKADMRPSEKEKYAEAYIYER